MEKTTYYCDVCGKELTFGGGPHTVVSITLVPDLLYYNPELSVHCRPVPLTIEDVCEKCATALCVGIDKIVQELKGGGTDA